MDKKYDLFWLFFQVDKKYDLFFCSTSIFQKTSIILHRQIKTEAGSAGEQPVRDKFDLYSILRIKDCFCSP